MIILEYVLSELARALPFPKRDADKYTRGKLTVIGGSAEYPGAASLAAMAAQSMGAGYVEVLCAPESVSVIRCARPSLVVSPWDGGRFAAAMNADATSAAHPRAVLIGSGLGAEDTSTHAMLYEVLEKCACPVVVDGGGISALATAKGIAFCKERAAQKRQTVITPHMGEACRMAVQIRTDAPSPNAAEGSLARFAHTLSEGMSATVILKGATTFVTSGEDEVYAMRQGTSALAKAGSGDVLAGMVAALFAQNTEMLKGDSAKACVLAATLHALAGRIAAEKKTDISVNPEDLVDNIHNAIRYILEFV